MRVVHRLRVGTCEVLQGLLSDGLSRWRALEMKEQQQQQEEEEEHFDILMVLVRADLGMDAFTTIDL